MMDTWIWFALAAMLVIGLVLLVRHRRAAATVADDTEVRPPAEGLAEHLADFNESLRRVSDELREAKSARFRDRVITGFLIVVLAGLGGVVYQNWQNAKAACESGNNRVAGQRAWMENYFDVSDAGAVAQNQADGPIGQYYIDLRAWTLDETLPFRDCDHLDEPIPKPGDPPSFEEALKAAIADQAND